LGVLHDLQICRFVFVFSACLLLTYPVDATMTTKEPKEPKEPKHRVEGIRQPQRKDSLTTSVLTYLQGKTIPPKPSSIPSSGTTPFNPTSTAQGLSKPRRHSHSADIKKKARKSSTKLRRSSFSNLADIQEDTSTKTRHAKTPDGSSKPAKSGSSEKVNKTARDPADMRKKKSQHHLAGASPETKTPT
jgi:hypothetical protein